MSNRRSHSVSNEVTYKNTHVVRGGPEWTVTPCLESSLSVLTVWDEDAKVPRFSHHYLGETCHNEPLFPPQRRLVVLHARLRATPKSIVYGHVCSVVDPDVIGG